MVMQFVFLALFLILIIYVLIAFLTAQRLMRERPVRKLFEKRKNSEDFCPLDSISDEFKKYFILIEDPDFFHHNGVNIRNIIKRIYNSLFRRDKINHGSTISQQLAKNLYFHFDRTLFRKLKELFVCLKIEHCFSKEEIFIFYLNIIYFGNNVYGIKNASKYYFNKEPATLTANQSVFLACLIAAPNVVEPIHYPGKFFRLKQRKLENCFQEGLISKEEMEEFLSFPEECPDPEFAQAFKKDNSICSIRMENEKFGILYD